MNRTRQIIVCVLLLTGAGLARAQEQAEVKKSTQATQSPPPAAPNPPAAPRASSPVGTGPATAVQAPASSEHPNAGKGRIHRMKVCDKDVAKLCPGVGTAGPERDECLRAHQDELSELCKRVWNRWSATKPEKSK